MPRLIVDTLVKWKGYVVSHCVLLIRAWFDFDLISSCAKIPSRLHLPFSPVTHLLLLFSLLTTAFVSAVLAHFSAVFRMLDIVVGRAVVGAFFVGLHRLAE